MTLTSSPTELTTAATDAVLAIECILIIGVLWRARSGDRWKTRLWCSVFGLLAFVSMLGAVAHGFVLSYLVQTALWKPIYLCLGVIVGLFVTGAVYDWLGMVAARLLVPWSIGLGIMFFAITQLYSDAFIVFIFYEAVALTGSFIVYFLLALTRRLKGASLVAVAIFVNLVAAVIQASDLSLKLLVPFDHNGVFHLVQIIGIAALGAGLRMGLSHERG